MKLWPASDRISSSVYFGDEKVITNRAARIRRFEKRAAFAETIRFSIGSERKDCANVECGIAFGALRGMTGKPFNIASYALLTHILAQQCGLEVGEFIWTGGDCHLYSNHLEQAQLQLTRSPGPLPRLEIVRKPDSIDAYEYEDFVLHDYVAQAHIKAPVAV